MRHRHFHSPALIDTILITLILFLAGCDSTSLFLATSGSSPSDSLVVLAAGATSGNVVDKTDAGNNFYLAQRLAIPDFGKVDIHGALANAFDVNFFSFGPVAAGDLIVADVHAASANTCLALFDDERMLVAVNDDRNYYAGQRDPFLQLVARRECAEMFVAIAVSPLANKFAGPQANMPYSISLTRAAGQPVPGPNPQVVWIELGGGRGVRIAGEAPQDVPAFDVGRIAERHRPAQDHILELALAKVAADYADFNVTILRSDRDTRPGEPYSILYFGGYSSVYLGLADSVDYYNAQTQQEAIIYTETLQLFEALRPSDDQVAQAIANVAAHELGHLLGLDHTNDPRDLMSTAVSAQQVIGMDETFMAASLSPGVFPIGEQNSRAKLAMGAGLRDVGRSLDEFLRDAAARRAIPDIGPMPDEADELPLESLGLHLCSHDAPH